MVVKRADLLDVLKQCMPGVESGNITLEGADTFIFSGGNIYTYNDTISVRVPITETGLIEEPLEGAVKATEFFNIINKLQGEEIKTSSAEGKWILKSGKAKVELNLIEFDFKARLSNVDAGDEGWADLPKDFQMGIGLCRMSCNRSSLSGVVFNGDAILSTDGWQINRCNIPNANLPLFWVNDPAASELLKLIGLKQMNLKGSWVHFKTETGAVFSVKTLQVEKWPIAKITRLLDEENKKADGDITGTFPKDLFGAIDRASSFSMDMDDYETVQLLLSSKGISVSSHRTAGKFKETVNWETMPEKLLDSEFVLNVSSTMMAHASKRSMGFYIHSTEKAGKQVDRIIFTGEHSVHLLSTFQPKTE